MADPFTFTFFTLFSSLLQIVRQDRTMEQIVFPIPEICEYLTEETKIRVYLTTERDDQGSKVTDYFERVEDMFAEMKWQKKLRGKWKCDSQKVSGVESSEWIGMKD